MTKEWDVPRFLRYLASLETGWYEPGIGLPVDPHILKVTERYLHYSLIQALPWQPDIVPTITGGIQLEWHTELGDLIVEPQWDEEATFYYVNNATGTEIEDFLSEDVDAFIEVWVYALHGVDRPLVWDRPEWEEE